MIKNQFRNILKIILENIDISNIDEIIILYLNCSNTCLEYI